MLSPLTPDRATRSDACSCGATCRIAAWPEPLTAWGDLTWRQTAAIIEADAATLEAIAAEAERFGRRGGCIR